MYPTFQTRIPDTSNVEYKYPQSKAGTLAILRHKNNAKLLGKAKISISNRKKFDFETDGDAQTLFRKIKVHF